MIRQTVAIFSMLAAGLVFGVPSPYAQSETHGHPPAGEHSDGLGIPKAMQVEHEALHSDLVRLTKAGGRTGEAAQRVAHVLDHHFKNENEYALPPLGLLVPLAEGRFNCGMIAVLKLTDKLQAEMPKMLAEHKDINAALSQLKDAAIAENKPEGVKFSDELGAHAQTEEQITYPTALLVGLYVKAKAVQCFR